MENISSIGNGNVDNSVLNKIVGLLKLAEKNNNANESASAAAAAQALLSKHRLTVADLGAALNGKPIEAPSVATEALITGNRINQWRSNLISAVCSANGCHYYYTKTFAKYGHGESRSRREFLISVVLIGRPSDVAVVRYFYSYLEREVERLSAIAFAGGGLTGKRDGNSFKVGVVTTVASRLQESVKASRVEAATEAVSAGKDGTTAMVRLDAADREVDEFYSTFTKGFKSKQHSSTSVNGDAYGQGREAGAGIALNKGLDGKPSKLLN
jgi:hypothetical protein